MQGVEMQYPPAYIQDASRQQQVQASPAQQQQQYAQYGAGSMLPPVAPQSLYDNIPYQQRQTAIEVMASQFAVPPYMPHGGHPGMGEVGSSSSQYMTTQPEQAVYGGTVPVTRAPLHQTYGGGQVDFPEVEQQATQPPMEPDINQEALNEGFRQYRQQIRSAFDSIVAGRVTEASERLLAASRWLVGSISALGE